MEVVTITDCITILRVALIACSKKKRPGKHKGHELYLGTMFKKSLQLARLEGYDHIFILSARYRLIGLNDVIGAYDLKLDEIDREMRRGWAKKVIGELRRRVPNYENAEYTYFAGKMYHQDLPPGRKPFSGKGIGQIVQWLNQQIAKLT